MSPRFSHNAILLGLLALATAPQAFADGTSPEEQSFELGQITITGRRTRSSDAGEHTVTAEDAAATAKISPKHSSPCPA